eukprot:gene13401-biopygen9565
MAADADRARAGCGPHDRIRRKERGPDASRAGSTLVLPLRGEDGEFAPHHSATPLPPACARSTGGAMMCPGRTGGAGRGEG